MSNASISDLFPLEVEKRALKKYLAHLECQLIEAEADPGKYSEVKAGYEREYRQTAKLVIETDRQLRMMQERVRIEV